MMVKLMENARRPPTTPPASFDGVCVDSALWVEGISVSIVVETGKFGPLMLDKIESDDCGSSVKAMEGMIVPSTLA